MAKYINQLALENALSPKTVLAIYDDDPPTGAVNATAIADVIDRAEAEVDSWLVGVYVDPATADRMLKHAALDYAVAFSFERHPEYVRTFGEEKRAERWRRANDRMARIRSGLQRLPDQPSPITAPKNSGGVVYDHGPRLMVDSSDGAENGSGF